MGLFGGRGKARDDGSRQAEAISRFWDWWSQEGMARSSSALADLDPSRIVPDLTSHIEAISSDLAWEFAKGDTSMHRLVVTADGDPAQRAPARRWLDAAPEADMFWTYADARAPMPDLDEAVLELDSITLPLGQTQVGVRRAGTRLDVQVHHPRLEELNPGARSTFCFLAIDAAVGETMTETWIGELQPALVAPLDSFGLSGLRAVVRDLASEFDGEASWVMLEGTSQLGPVRVMARVPLAAASAPTLDEAVVVTAAYDAGPDGLPSEPAEQQLESFRAHLVARLEQQGELVAVVMTGGRCEYNFYVDSTRTGAAQLQAAARAWTGKVDTQVERDPGWARVAHLRG